MRTILIAMLVAAGIGLTATTGVLAGPANGVAISAAADATLLTEDVHCRRYPHRHRGAKPHGWGFGCPKKTTTPPKKST